MKKLFAISFCCLALTVTDGQQLKDIIQPNKFRYKIDSAASELAVTDPLIEKQHYKTVNTSLKKGQAAVFFMHSSAFKPYVLLMTQKLVKIGQAVVNQDGTAECWLNADRDTSFIVILTSAEENKTGKFSYGYKLMNPDLIDLDSKANFCDRFSFLMNHWALEWRFMPTQFGFYFDIDEQMENKNAPADYTATKYTLMGDRARLVQGFYQEILHSDYRDSTISAADFYKKMNKDIQACLDMDNWTIEEEKKEAPYNNGTMSIYYEFTHFYRKGSQKGNHLSSFMIVHEWGSFLSMHGSKVTLVFN